MTKRYNKKEIVIRKSHSIKTLANLVQYYKAYESANKNEDKWNSIQSQPNLNLTRIDIGNTTEDKVIAAVSNYWRNKKYNENEQYKCRNCGFNNHNGVNGPAQGKECTKCGKKNHFERVSRSKTFNKHIWSVILSTIDRIVD